MRRAEDIALEDTTTRAQEVAEALPLRLVDLVITSLATLGAAYLVIAARWVPGWLPAFITLSIIALGPPVFRGLAVKWPNIKLFDFLASIWLMPSVIFGHFCLEPVVNAAHPKLLDPYLAEADLRLFGGHPSFMLGQHVGPVLTEILLVCYYSYFIGPFTLAMLLYFKGAREQYEEFALALAFFFAANFLFYAAVPAVGPRYYLAGIFPHPLQGLWLTPYLDGLMRTTVFARDCFPSGHTGVTLVVLTFAWRYRRNFFWGLLPVGTGLILGTLVGRFHYGIDLICAVPLVITCVGLAALIARSAPDAALRGATLGRVRRQRSVLEELLRHRL